MPLNPLNIQKLLAALSIANEMLVLSKDDLIAVQKQAIQAHISNAKDRKSKRFREREGAKNLQSYIEAISRIYNASNRILAPLEKDEESRGIVEKYVEVLSDALNSIEIEVK